MRPQNGLLIFLGKETHTFRNKIMEIVEDFDEKSYNNNGKPWKSSRILRVNPTVFIFFHFLSFSDMFFHFLSFFYFFNFSIFSLSFTFFTFFHFLSFFIFSFVFHFSFFQKIFIFFHFLSFSIIFFRFLSISFIFIFFHFLFSFFFSFFVGSSKSNFFWASISLRFQLTILL